MTFIVAHRLADRIELLSDGAVYDDAGFIRGSECKVMTMPGVPAVVAGSGKSVVVNAIEASLRTIFAAVTSFDRAIEEIRAGLGRLVALKDHPPFRIVIAGMSETRGPEVYRFGNVAEEGIAAFALHRCEFGAILQHDIPEALHRHFVAMGGLRAGGIDLMENVRREGAADGSIVIGCHVDFTTVSAAGVVSEEIHEWPDRIGHRIAPAARQPRLRVVA